MSHFMPWPEYYHHDLIQCFQWTDLHFSSFEAFPGTQMKKKKKLDCSNDPETLHMFSNHRIVSVLGSLFPTLLSFSTYKKTPLNPCKLTAFFFFNDFIHHFVKQMLNVTNPFSCHSNDLLLNLTLEEVQLTLSFHHYPAFLQKLGSVT